MHLSALAATTKKTPSLYRYLARHLLLAMEVFSEEPFQGAILRLLKRLSIRALRPQQEPAVKQFVCGNDVFVSQQAVGSLNVTVYYHL